MSSLEEKSIRVIEFSGKSSDWKIWSRKFLARANRKGYKKLLLGEAKIPTEDQYTLACGEANSSEKKTVKLWQLNEAAFEELLLSINGQTKQGRIAFNLVDNCVTDDQPEGNCKIAWERLVHKYAPKTAPSYIQLKKDFANSKLRSADANPDEWMTDLESLRTEMNKVKISGKTDMSEVDLIIHILSNLPEEYEVAVSELEEEKLKDTSNPLDMEAVREKLNSRYERITKNTEEKEEEKAFAAFKRQYKGTCGKCGEYGHNSGDCPDNEPNSSRDTESNGGEFQGKCHYCDKYGHKKAECRKRKKDLAEKAESTNDEKAKVAIDEIDDEYESDIQSLSELGFIAMDRTKENVTSNVSSTDHRDESSICVEGASTDGTGYLMFGDAGSSCHIVNDDRSIYDTEIIDEIVGGISSDVRATKKGKVRCLFKQVDGSSTEKVLSVKYCEQARDSVLSLTAEMSNGATLGSSDSNDIILSYPDGSMITFDRHIKTRDGWVGCINVIPIIEDLAQDTSTSTGSLVETASTATILKTIVDEVGTTDSTMESFQQVFGKGDTSILQNSAKTDDEADMNMGQKLHNRCFLQQESVPVADTDEDKADVGYNAKKLCSTEAGRDIKSKPKTTMKFGKDFDIESKDLDVHSNDFDIQLKECEVLCEDKGGRSMPLLDILFSFVSSMDFYSIPVGLIVSKLTHKLR